MAENSMLIQIRLFFSKPLVCLSSLGRVQVLYAVGWAEATRAQANFFPVYQGLVTTS